VISPPRSKLLMSLARTQDNEFRNADGERVRWTLSKLETLDELEEGKLKDQEVYSRISPIEPPDISISIDHDFTPDKPEPGLSGVWLSIARRRLVRALDASTVSCVTCLSGNRNLMASLTNSGVDRPSQI
jgi:hypothetical protein